MKPLCRLPSFLIGSLERRSQMSEGYWRRLHSQMHAWLEDLMTFRSKGELYNPWGNESMLERIMYLEANLEDPVPVNAEIAVKFGSSTEDRGEDGVHEEVVERLVASDCVGERSREGVEQLGDEEAN
jgi:hypothetical protein